MRIVFLILVFFVKQVVAQDRSGNVWCFGGDAELDFNNGPPIEINNCAIGAGEGCASIADKNTGQLLFYTDGVNAWNRNNQFIFGYLGPLGGGSSSTQSAIIIPKPGSNHEYYIFTVAEFVLGGLSYSIVDMNLDNGLGGISQRPQTLLAITTEKLTAAKMSNGNGFWIVVHEWSTDAFYAYPIESSGIGAPVVSHVGLTLDQNNSTQQDYIGYMKISPDETKIAMAVAYETNTLQVFNFNKYSGVISNIILSDNTIVYTNEGIYGLSFSPDSRLLYVAQSGAKSIYQYDLTLANANDILASRNIVGTSSTAGMEIGALQLAPDKKIYLANEDTSLDRINNPNVYGPGCDFESKAFVLHYGWSGAGLPNIFDDIYAYTDPPDEKSDIIAIPNAFTPNGDGKNDVFYPLTRGAAKVVAFSIYSRWGQLVYNNPNIGWDGKFEGKDQPAGTYFYYTMIKLPDINHPSEYKEINKSGPITLLR